jgi:RND superfamily putative drug exporter
VADGLGAGFNGPLLVVTTGSDAPAAAASAAKAAASTQGVAAVTAVTTGPDGATAVFNVIPTTSPQDHRTTDLTHHLRDDVLPTALDGTRSTVRTTGSTSANVDLADRIGDRLPLFLAAVIGISFLLLMVVFRSVFVPLKAAICNLLSVAAGYGVVVAVFQWGWGKGLIGLGETVPIEAWVPMMMFAILFGLSMDYEVFLISRIREHWLRTGDSHQSVVDGVASTASVITSAAVIMVSVFASFVLVPDPVVKMIGLGLAVSVLIDATVIRMVTVPATMELLGDANWWLPRWLDRILPTLDLEGEGDEDAEIATDEVIDLGSSSANTATDEVRTARKQASHVR